MSEYAEKAYDETLVNKAFAKLQKLNSNATTLEENTLSNVTEWIDTGCSSIKFYFIWIPVWRCS